MSTETLATMRVVVVRVESTERCVDGACRALCGITQRECGWAGPGDCWCLVLTEGLGTAGGGLAPASIP